MEPARAPVSVPSLRDELKDLKWWLEFGAAVAAILALLLKVLGVV